ncbi:MAG: YraN family protein [Alistipes sp.]|jgi:putative endonuclease|nr:YraN family protein [Alistipes sp.]
MGQTQIIGAAGEQEAERWLARHDFEIVARNWRDGRYELDIVALKNGRIHFIEVKTRADIGWESPEDALTAAKIRSFRRAAEAWIAQNDCDLESQMDLIAVDTDAGGVADVRYIAEAVIPRW